MSHSLPLPSSPRSNELAPVLIGWGVFITYLIVQCIAHQAFVSRVAIDLWDSIAWACREWGLWIALTPLLLRSVRNSLHAEAKAPHLLACVACLVIALGLRVSIDVIETAERPIASFIYFLPKHLGAWLVVIFAGGWLLRRKHDVATAPSSTVAEQPTRSARTLLVSKGRDECLIEIADVDSFTAAKNYVEIRRGGQSYLMRATLKEVESMLPPDTFVRAHRSHIVRLRAIERVRMLPTGTGIVTLRDGTTVSLSKKHYKTLGQYRLNQSPQPAERN